MVKIISRQSYYIWAGILALTAIALTQIPLFNLLGFEFSVIISILIGLAAAHIAIAGINKIRGALPNQIRWIVYDSPVSIVISVYFWTLIANLSLLILPVITISLNAFRVKNCDFAEGFAFFGLIPVITCGYSTAAGMFFGFLLSTRRRAYGAYLFYIFATILWGLYNIIFHPPVFGYNSVIGYFPGPIYDEQVSIDSALVIARVTTIILTGVFLLLITNTLDFPQKPRFANGLRLKLRNLYRYRLSYNLLINRIPLSVFVIAYALIFINQGDLGLRVSRSYIQERLGGRYETEHFNIYYEKGSEAEKEIELIAQDHEFRYYQLTRFFNLHPREKIGSYIYTSAEQKKRLIGAKYTEIEDAINREIHLNYRSSFPHPTLKHELAHLFASYIHPIWRMSLKIGLHEGIAVAADWDDGQLTPHQWSKAMYQLKVAPPVEKIMGAFGFWTESSSRSYTLAGSFVRFLVDTYGIEKFKKVFPTGDFKKHYGKGLKDLVNEWKDFLKGQKLSSNDMAIAEYRFKSPGVFEKPCAHRRAELASKAWDYYNKENYSAAINLFERIYNSDTNNPRPLRGILYSYYYGKNYDKALDTAEKIINHPKSDAYFVAMAKNFTGNIFWQRGKIGEAKQIFTEIYNLHISDNYGREMSAKLESLRYSELSDKMRDALISKEKGSIRMLLLKEILEQHPDFSLAYYLIGRQLYFEGKYPHSIEYLSMADNLGLPDESLTYENYRLLGEDYFYAEEYEKAISYFDKIIIPPAPFDKGGVNGRCLGEVNRAKDWIERCQWRLSSFPP
ncbi:MAG: tetratricopeptide repeat protein [Candidatus Poribacteria bacterium]